MENNAHMIIAYYNYITIITNTITMDYYLIVLVIMVI